MLLELSENCRASTSVIVRQHVRGEQFFSDSSSLLRREKQSSHRQAAQLTAMPAWQHDSDLRMGVCAKEQVTYFVSHDVPQNRGDTCMPIGMEFLYGTMENVTVNSFSFRVQERDAESSITVRP